MAFKWRYGENKNDIMCKNIYEFLDLLGKRNLPIDNLFLDSMDKYEELVNYCIQKYGKCNFTYTILLNLLPYIENDELFDKGFNLLCEAACDGDNYARCCVGKITELSGDGQQDKNVIQSYVCSALDGFLPAYEFLVSFLSNPRNSSYNEESALKWAELGAKAGNVKLMGEVAYRYMNGRGTDVDYSTAADWAMKAASKGDPLGQRVMGLLLYNDKIIENSKLIALDFLDKAASNGDVFSMFSLGYFYSDDEDVLDINKSIYWYNQAINCGSVEAMENLGQIYFYGENLGSPNYKAALKLFNDAVKHGSKSSCLFIGYIYYDGLGVEKNIEYALDNFLVSAKTGNEEAMYYVGKCYLYLEKYSNAMNYFILSAKKGYTLAQYTLAVMYAKGDIINRDLNESKKWLDLAAKSGDETILKDIAELIEREKK